MFHERDVCDVCVFPVLPVLEYQTLHFLCPFVCIPRRGSLVGG